MSRPVVKLHSIQQWFEVEAPVRQELLKHIKLRDRLWAFLGRESKKMAELTEPLYVPCRDCDGTGHILIEPRYDGLHPSQLPHPCLLKVYLEMLGGGEPKKIEPRLQITFDIGHAVHRMFQNYGLKGAWGPHYKKEIEISSRYQQLAAMLDIEGHADADNILVIDDIKGAPIYEVGLVHEYKTIKSQNFTKLTRPKPEHKIQATLYSAALDRPVVVYVYLNKDDSNIADFPVEFDYGVWRTVYEKAQLLKNHVDHLSPPPGTFGFHCQDCGNALNCETYKSKALKKRA